MSNVYASVVQALSPTAYYRLGEASGTTMKDASVHANDGSYTASGLTYKTIGAITGDGNTAITFDGAAGHGLMPSAFTDGATAFSLCFWMNLSNTSYTGSPCILANDNPQVTNNGVRVNLTTNGTRSITFVVGNGVGHGSANVGNTTSAGIWSFYVCTYDSTLGSAQMKVFINAISVKTATLTSAVGTAAHHMGLAWDGSAGSLLPAILDETTVIVGTALTQAQISALFNAGNNPGSNTSSCRRSGRVRGSNHPRPTPL